jgi:1-acyl-sn-glycerol-3-phosphate acyltransferase
MRSLWHAIFYRFVVGGLRLLITTGAHVRVEWIGTIPRGACVLAANHISHFDPPVLSGWLPRKIDWIAMSELFSTAWSKTGFHWLDVIPVDRIGDDRKALRTALERLAKGRMVGIFPEGGIRDGEASILNGAPMREGAFLIASKARCPVVPVVILGTDRLYNIRRWFSGRRARVFVAVGHPIPAGGRREMAEAAAQAFSDLKSRLANRFGLDADDFPKPPRERMREA